MFKHSCRPVEEWVCRDADTSRTTYPLFRESECPAHCQAEILETSEFEAKTMTTSRGDDVTRHCYMHFCDKKHDWVVRFEQLGAFFMSYDSSNP